MVSESVGRQVEYLGAAAPDMTVGVSFVDVRFGNHTDFESRLRSQVDFFAGTIDGRSFCLVAYPFFPPDPEEPRNQGNLSRAIRSLTVSPSTSNIAM